MVYLSLTRSRFSLLTLVVAHARFVLALTVCVSAGLGGALVGRELAPDGHPAEAREWARRPAEMEIDPRLGDKGGFFPTNSRGERRLPWTIGKRERESEEEKVA